MGFKARVKTEENTMLHKLSDDKISGKVKKKKKTEIWRKKEIEFAKNQTDFIGPKMEKAIH